MSESHVLSGPYKAVTKIEKYEGVPGKEPPFEIVEKTVYCEADGTPISDPLRIEEVERMIQGNPGGKE
jgi:hypothetical protein